MGDALSSSSYTPKQRTRYRQRLLKDLEMFDKHLQNADFVNHGTIGLELELNLVDGEMQPSTTGADVLGKLSEDYQSEIGSFNVELNLPPQGIADDGLDVMQKELERRLDAVRDAASRAEAEVAMIGTLPTLTTEFLTGSEWMTKENRYQALSNSVMEARGELVRIDLARDEHYLHDFKDIAPESACTSMQLHLQVAPNRFADAWNASQAIAGIQVALSANSPLFAGHRVWHESRIPLFFQSIDTRTNELVNQGVRPRVWFGERWITSVFDLFEENVRYFSPLIPEDRSDSGTPMMAGDNPALHYLNLQNGTIWRWNRPIYDPNTELAHIRLENRLLPAGPTPADIIADAAFYYGLVKFLSEQTRPVWSRLSFSQAEENFNAGARDGLNAMMHWPTLGRISVKELVNDHLLDQARAGLQALGVRDDLIDSYLSIIDGRIKAHQNGATWQLAALAQAGGRNVKPESRERREALQKMLRQYLKLQATNQPVHTWPRALD